MLRLLEAIRQENKREREEIRSRLAKIEDMVGQVLEREAAAMELAMATPTANRDEIIGSHARVDHSNIQSTVFWMNEEQKSLGCVMYTTHVT